MKSGVAARPVHVQIILSDLCNQACSFCAYRDPSYTSSQRFFEIKPLGAGLRKDTAHPERNYNPNRLLPWDKVEEILDDCAEMGVEAIQFTGGGEPTVHPKWREAVSGAVSRGMKAAVVTNGVNAAKDPDALADCEWVRVSIDAAKPETYAGIRHVPVAHFDRAWETVRALGRHSGRSKRPTVGVGFVVTRDNWEEVEDCAYMAFEAGADNVRIGAQFSADDEKLFEGIRWKAHVSAKAAEMYSAPGLFEVVNRFGEKLDDLTQGRPDYQSCGYQQFTTYIGADQTVYRCCVLAYNDRGDVGSLKQQRFKDLWMNQARADAMRDFDARGCDRCQFNTINRSIAYATQHQAPPHSAFV